MQAPQLPRPFLNGKVGYFVALACSGFSLFSFLAFPFADISYCFIICFSNTSLFFRQQLSQGNALSWSLLAAVIITCIVALIGALLMSSTALAISLVVTSLMGAGLFLWAIIRIPIISNASPDIGIWLCFFGMIVATIGGIATITASQRMRRN